MAETPRIALLGFLPWTDPGRGVAVRENPSALVAESCARELQCAFIPVVVSDDGILQAMEPVRLLGSQIVVALGQTSTEPRVERYGRVPCTATPALPGETQPWLLANDTDAIVPVLNALLDPSAQTAPFRSSDDAGAYFCDHLCVELARDQIRRGTRARFLHITSIDGVSADVRAARLRQYQRQTRATVDWLMGPREAVE